MCSTTRFQFLGRNSGRSDAPPPDGWFSYADVFQFLGRNSGRSDLGSFQPLVSASALFQFLGRNSGRSDLGPRSSKHLVILFQFLGRNSGRSDVYAAGPGVTRVPVSIPRSEFWSFGHAQDLGESAIDYLVSIPRSEFWSFGLAPGRPTAEGVGRFNSSVGILVVRTATATPTPTTPG